jgi:hypothetical protein
MPREITPATSLDTLRKEAKRWLKALRANLADLREVAVDSAPGVTLQGTRVFPAGVRVRYST